MAESAGVDDTAGIRTEEIVGENALNSRTEGKDENSLAHEFYDVYKAYRRILKSDGEPPQQTELDDLSGQIKAIAARVGQLHLFSPNEELEDVCTADLKFLLIPSLLGEVLGATRGFEDRSRALRHALVCWRGFIGDCQRLGI